MRDEPAVVPLRKVNRHVPGALARDWPHRASRARGMIHVVLNSPQIPRSERVAVVKNVVEAQRHLWAAGARLQAHGIVEPWAWIDESGTLRDGLRITVGEGAEFFLFIEEEDPSDA